MRNYKLLPVWLVLAASFIQCGLPSKPDFTTSHKVEAPLLFEKKFQLLGGGDTGPEALIDTTKENDFDSLFTIVEGGIEDGFIVITQTEEFDFGDLNDAIPTISVDDNEFSSEVGELELGSFSSGTNSDLGSVDIGAVIPIAVPAGTPVAAGNNSANPVIINIGDRTDFFSSATIKEGLLELEVTNDLGFDFDSTIVTLIDNVTGSTLGIPAIFSESNGNKLESDGQSKIGNVSFNEDFFNGEEVNKQLSNLAVSITIYWEQFNYPANPGFLAVNNAQGQGLVASEVIAAVTEQDFSTTSTTVFNSEDFQFGDENQNHFVELESGTISMAAINNGLDLTIESLVVTFPTIVAGEKTPPESGYNEGDPLVLSYVGDNKILRSSQSDPQTIDLTGFILSAPNNEISYTVSALTENTQDNATNGGEPLRSIREDQKIESSVSILDLKIATAVGIIAPQTTLLGDDADENGEDIADLYNETEVSLTEIPGLEDFSSNIDGLEFTQASLTINYSSNIGIPTTIFAAILGVNGEGEEVYLMGTPGTEREVTLADGISGLQANGVELTTAQMVKFTLAPSPNDSTIFGSITFDEDNTNVNEFLNNLPNEIRFIGKSIINQSGGEARIATPLEFDPSFAVELPLAFQTTQAASYTDTLEVDVFKDIVPDSTEDIQIASADLIIDYENGIPLEFGLELLFVNDDYELQTSAPIAGDDPLVLSAASVDPVTRFVSETADSELRISLTLDQIKKLKDATNIILSATVHTSEDSEVKLKATDFITLSGRIEVNFETNVNLD